MSKIEQRGCCCRRPEAQTAERTTAQNVTPETQSAAPEAGNVTPEAGNTAPELQNTERTTERTDAEYKSLMNRLSRIEGQIKGIRGMLEKDAYCTDIITQVSAVTAALNAFNKELLSNHIKGCVTRDILEGREDTVDDLLKTLQRLMK